MTLRLARRNDWGVEHFVQVGHTDKVTFTEGAELRILWPGAARSPSRTSGSIRRSMTTGARTRSRTSSRASWRMCTGSRSGSRSTPLRLSTRYHDESDLHHARDERPRE